MVIGWIALIHWTIATAPINPKGADAGQDSVPGVFLVRFKPNYSDQIRVVEQWIPLWNTP